MYSGFQDCAILEILSLLDFHVCENCMNLEILAGELMEWESRMMNCCTNPTALEGVFHSIFEHRLLRKLAVSNLRFPA